MQITIFDSNETIASDAPYKCRIQMLKRIRVKWLKLNNTPLILCKNAIFLSSCNAGHVKRRCKCCSRLNVRKKMQNIQHNIKKILSGRWNNCLWAICMKLRLLSKTHPLLQNILYKTCYTETSFYFYLPYFIR